MVLNLKNKNFLFYLRFLGLCNKWIPETPCKRLLRYILFVNQHFLYVIGKIKESCISGFTCDLNLYT